jgi:hypothetical protein
MTTVDQQKIRRWRNPVTCIFEVTSAGEVVWEYVNPHFFEAPGRPGINNAVFRAFRYTPDEIAAARRA